mgnify:CR=1 FL=1
MQAENADGRIQLKKVESLVAQVCIYCLHAVVVYLRGKGGLEAPILSRSQFPRGILELAFLSNLLVSFLRMRKSSE